MTHDQEEAFEVADHVVVMNKGRIEQVGTPAEVFERPATAFVMDFLGNVNVFQGRVERGKAVLSGVELPLLELAPRRVRVFESGSSAFPPPDRANANGASLNPPR